MSADVDPEEIRPGLWCLPMPIPYGPLSTTLGYAIVADDGVHLIDPGWESDANEARLARMLEQIGRSLNEVRTVIVTHHHPDHLGLADHVRRESGAHLVMSATEHAVLVRVAAPDLRDADGYQARLDGWGVPAERRDGLIESHADSIPSAPTRPDRTVHDGETLTLGDRALTVVETPGHTSGHICLVDTAAGVIFTGDHVLPEIYSGLGLGMLPGSEPVAELVASLDRLAPYDDFEVLPGHRRRFRGLGQRRRRIAAHHLRRLSEVAALAPELGDAPVWEYARRLTWTLGWEGLQAFALHSALHQTELHLRAAQADSGAVLIARALSSG